MVFFRHFIKKVFCWTYKTSTKYCTRKPHRIQIIIKKEKTFHKTNSTLKINFSCNIHNFFTVFKLHENKFPFCKIQVLTVNFRVLPRVIFSAVRVNECNNFSLFHSFILKKKFETEKLFMIWKKIFDVLEKIFYNSVL